MTDNNSASSLTNNEPRTWISVGQAAALIARQPSTIISRIRAGRITGELLKGTVFTSKGETNYKVLLESLPIQAQYRYYQLEMMKNGEVFDLDLVSIREFLGENGFLAFGKRAEMLAKDAQIRQAYRGDRKITEKLHDLAAEYGISYRTLLRYEKSDTYTEITKLYLDPVYLQEHLPYSMCLLSADHAFYLHFLKNKHFGSTDIFRLQDTRLKDCIPCSECVYREDTATRARYEKNALHSIPVCREDREFMKTASSRNVIADLLKHIPNQFTCFAREGMRKWNEQYGHFVLRQKPLLSYECLQGDHHVFNVFVRLKLRETRNGVEYEREILVRPVLTAWMDTATGALVGWVISIIPNSMTIAESFCIAAAYTVGSEFHGLPSSVLVDCGKDYRSALLEAIPEEMPDWIDKVPSNEMLMNKFARCGFLTALNVTVHHAREYHPQTKNIERMFGTIEKGWISKLDGWCYEKASDRPPGFMKDLRALHEHGRLMEYHEFIRWFQNVCVPEYNNSRQFSEPDSAETAEATSSPDAPKPWEWHIPDDRLSPLELYRKIPRARNITPSSKSLAIMKKDRRNNVVCTLRGIEFSHHYYWSDEMRWLTGLKQRPTEIDILFNKPVISDEFPTSITVIYQGHFVCEAPVVESVEFIGEDPRVLQGYYDDLDHHKKEISGTLRRINKVMKLTGLSGKESLRIEAYGPAFDREKDAALATDFSDRLYSDDYMYYDAGMSEPDTAPDESPNESGLAMLYGSEDDEADT